ncbi:hypothetical protein G155_00057 [Mycobacterium sp. VKM Ac-1817D]|nr:hypothetical protein G155_00057 [Mycobacterium sp. VKM Ac-1817D]
MEHLRRRYPRYQGPNRIGQIAVLRRDRNRHAVPPSGAYIY